MQPTIGKIVLYKDKGSGQICPAIITLIYADGAVNLTLFKPNQIDYAKNISMAAGPDTATPGSWWLAERIAG